MEIDVLHIAELSNLEIREDELARFSKQMSNIIDMVSVLPDEMLDIECENEPMLLRKDEVCESMPVNKSLSNAPDVFDGCFSVPRTVD